MEKINTTVVYDHDKVIKNFEISGFYAQMLESFLMHYITTVEDQGELLTIYKKIDDLSNGEKIQLDQRESYFYLLTALVKTLRKLALEQGVAKEVAISEAAAAAAKKTAGLYLDSISDDTKKKDFAESYKEVLEIFKKEASS